jgi:glutaredoxin
MITVYTTRTCSKCPTLKMWLKNKGIVYAEHDLTDDNTEQQRIIEATSSMTVPVTEVNGQYVVGLNFGRLAELLTT